MFVHYFVEVDRPLDEVEAALTGNVDHLRRCAIAARRHGEELRVRIGQGGSSPDREVVLDLGAPMPISGGWIHPIGWKEVGADGALLPTLEGDLTTASLGGGTTQVSLQGRYRPLFAGLAGVFDRALLHRVALSTVRDFLERLRIRLERGDSCP